MEHWKGLIPDKLTGRITLKQKESPNQPMPQETRGDVRDEPK